MILENQVSSPFAAKVRQIASRLGVPPDYLMAVMWSESRLDPAATNPEGGATGLIQFMPATAAGLGTSCEALREMSALDQLDYVERFFRPYAPRCHTFGDFYMACGHRQGRRLCAANAEVVRRADRPAKSGVRHRPGRPHHRRRIPPTASQALSR